jgi:YgiT-type zinc finger domain-containing protein
MKCIICRFGKASPGVTKIVHERNDHVVLIKGMPADVCDACGEAYFAADVAQNIYDLAEAAFARGHQFEIVNYTS